MSQQKANPKHDLPPTKEDLQKIKEEQDATLLPPLLGFQLQKIQYDGRKYLWTLDIEIRGDVKIIERFYNLRFIFNDLPFRNQIRIKDAALASAAMQPSLLEDEEKNRVRMLENDLNMAIDDLKKNERMCHPIEFTSEAKKVEYGSPTKVTFTIPKEVLSTVNDKLEILSLYGVRLTPIKID